MSIADRLPIRLGLFDRPTGKRRAPDEIDRLNNQLAGANMLIAGLQVQLDDTDARHAEVIARIDERHAEIVRGLEAQLAEMERRLDIACKAESAVAITQPIRTLPERFADGPVVSLHHSPMAVTDPGRIS